MDLFARGVDVSRRDGRLLPSGLGRILTACSPRRSHAATSSSTMDANSQRQKGRDDALSSLNMAVDAINLAKDIVDIAPAKAAFGSVSALLTMIRVRFFLFCNDELQVHMYPGLDGERTRLRRARVELRRHLQSP
jgi:hypothetical protein